jgi:uncharacterized protein YegJ (DUF2314 family)
MRFILILAAAWWISLAGCSGKKKGDNYVHINEDDKAMEKAVETARATTTNFVQAFREQKAGTKNFFLKRPYSTPTGGQEHMWIEVTGEEGGDFTGIVSNDAEETKEVKRGQRVKLKLDEISDWKYEDGKKLIGGYTIRYFVEKMPPAERKAFLKEAGFEL